MSVILELSLFALAAVGLFYLLLKSWEYRP